MPTDRYDDRGSRPTPPTDLYRRPDPEALLARLERLRQGHLKIFLGLAPGVGKTYAMLEEAHSLKSAGVDVVIGVVDTHGRADTAKLLDGLEAVPLKKIAYRGMVMEEMDPQAVLARKPELCLVDELAHTNVPGSPRTKRFEDVEWLLDQGIHVHATLNVQHLESLNDAVFQITGVAVNETVPTSILDAAAEIRLVDLSPEELLTRLSEGKVYPPHVVAQARSNFFREGNLTALRELSLRTVAEHIDQRLIEYMRVHGIEGAWRTQERIMVAISPHPGARRLVRRGFRLATRMHGEFHVVYVEPPGVTLTLEQQQALERALKLAQELRAEVHVLKGNVYREILTFAREFRITNAVLGVSERHQGIFRLKPSLLEALQRAMPELEILLVGR